MGLRRSPAPNLRVKRRRRNKLSGKSPVKAQALCYCDQCRTHGRLVRAGKDAWGNRWFADSLPERDGFEISVPRQIGSGFEASVGLGRLIVGAAESSERRPRQTDSSALLRRSAVIAARRRGGGLAQAAFEHASPTKAARSTSNTGPWSRKKRQRRRFSA